MNREDFLEVVRREGLTQWPNLDAQQAAGIDDASRSLSTLRGSVVINHPSVRGLRMDLDASIGPKIFHLLRSGAYEAGDFDLYRSHLVHGERVLDLGGGVGVTAAYCALITGCEVIVVEPNPRLHPLIRRQATVNGVHVRIDTRCAIATNAMDHVPFYLHAELWRSTLVPEPHERYQQIQVDTVAVNSLIEATRPDVLIVDIEGAEQDLFHSAPCHLPKKLFVEIHVPKIGETASADLMERLTGLGYTLTDHRDWMFYFQAAKERL